MKRVFTYTFMILSLAIGLAACSDDGDDSPKSTEKYFAISNGSYVNESFPTATSADSSLYLSINSQLNSGETANLFISADNEVSKVFIGVKGTNGYWAYDPTSNLQTRASNTAFPSANYKTYLIPITISQSYNGNLSLIVSVQYTDGGISYPIIQNIQVAKNSSSDSKDSTINVPEYLKPFVGLWDIKDQDTYRYGGFYDNDHNDHVFIYQDGVCIINGNKTTWNYDISDKYLTFIGNDYCLWQITAISDVGWTGIGLSDHKVYTAKKDTSIINIFEYRFGVWKCDTITARIFSFSNSEDLVVYKGNPTFKYRSYDDMYGHSYSSVSNVDDFAWYRGDYYDSYKGHLSSFDYNQYKDRIVCKSKYWENPNTTGHYIEMVHPYSYKDVYLNITFRYRNNQNKIETWSGKFLPSK